MVGGTCSMATPTRIRVFRAAKMALVIETRVPAAAGAGLDTGYRIAVF